MARLVDTTLRILAQEPIAGRVPASLQFEACELLDSAGFHVLEVTGGGCFQTAVQRGTESPWERIRNLKRRATRTPLGMALRGRFLVGTQPAEQDLIRRFVDSAAESGIAVFRMHDPMNDPEDLVGPIEAVRETGARLHLGLVYDEHPEGASRMLARAAELAALGADRLLLLDPAGALDPSQTGPLITQLRDAAKIPVGLYPQGPGGTSLAVAIEAARAGADPISVATYSLAVSGHRTSSELLCQAIDGLGLELGIPQGQAHGFGTTDPARGGGSDVVGVAGHAVAHHLSQDLGSPGLGVVQAFEHQHPGAFADHEAVALRVEGAAGGGGIVVAEGQGLGTGKTGDPQGGDR